MTLLRGPAPVIKTPDDDSFGGVVVGCGQWSLGVRQEEARRQESGSLGFRYT